VLYRRGRAILKEKEGALHELMKLLGAIEGPLAISSSTIPGEYLLPPILAAFRKGFPGVTIRVRISDSEGVCRQLMDATCELGFLGTRPDVVGLELLPFASDQLALVVPNDDEWGEVRSIDLATLAARPFLAREAGSGTRAAFERVTGRSLEQFNIAGYLGSSTAVKEGIKAGLGVSVMSLFAVRSELESGVLKTIDIDDVAAINRDFYVAYNKNLTISPIAESFLAFALGMPSVSMATA